MLHGRPIVDAPSLHDDEVKQLPQGAVLLLYSASTSVQAVEMRVENSVFWGTQYHPEISLPEIALAIEDKGDDAINHGFARSRQQLEDHLAKFIALGEDPERVDLAWELGLDEQITRFNNRTAEIQNFLKARRRLDDG